MDTETVTVNGNGTYTTPTGFTLPTTGTVTGTYQWDASLQRRRQQQLGQRQQRRGRAGDGQPGQPDDHHHPQPDHGHARHDAGDPERHGGAGGRLSPDRHDHLHAVTSGSTLVDTETVAVNGNGTYTTPTGFTLPTTGTVTGTYQWDATYSGDTNNNSASDNNAAAEQVTVSAASPTITHDAEPDHGHAGHDAGDA